MSLFLQVVGAGLVLVALADVLLTVLVARHGSTLLSERLFAINWRLFRVATRHWKRRRRDRAFVFTGPANIVVMFLAWVGLMWLGFALVYWTMLGRSIFAASGPTSTTFVSALYVSADCLTTAGNGDFLPVTNTSRLINALNCTIGISTFTLTLTYIVQLYATLQRRNALADCVHGSTGSTGHAYEWVAGLGAGGSFEGAASDIGQVVTQLADVHEAYHFYPSLIYFRFVEPHYTQARCAAVLLDSASLIRTTVCAERHTHFVRCGAVRQLYCGGQRLLEELTRVYACRPVHALKPDELTLHRWRRHFDRARERLAEEDIHLASNADASFARYVEERCDWEPAVRALADHMAEPADEIFTDGDS